MAEQHKFDPSMIDLEKIPTSYVTAVEYENCGRSHDVICENLAVADTLFDVTTMTAACMAYLRYDKNRTPTDLYDYMKSKGMQTRIIAVHNTQIPEFKSMIESKKARAQKTDGEETSFIVWLSCRPIPHSVLEMFKYRQSEEENRDLLRNAGFMVATPNAVDPQIRLSEKEKEVANSICDGTQRIIATKLDLKSMFLDDMKNRDGSITLVKETARNKLFGLFKDGLPVSRVFIHAFVGKDNSITKMIFVFCKNAMNE